MDIADTSFPFVPRWMIDHMEIEDAESSTTISIDPESTERTDVAQPNSESRSPSVRDETMEETAAADPGRGTDMPDVQQSGNRDAGDRR